MLVFALSIGFVHVTLGLTMGLIGALHRRTNKEALAIFLNLVLLTIIGLLLIVFFDLFPDLLARPFIILILLLAPVLLFAGGLLAPLELLKTIGNIVSYARIMAIGLTSVLLAQVANMLSGLTGDFVLGAVVALLIHLINIIIGVFASSIHSLRLHYVEFFDKFVETGGRPFQPLRRPESDHPAEGLRQTGTFINSNGRS
jgi:V/A-type H+-transporting ATPase subunit I